MYIYVYSLSHKEKLLVDDNENGHKVKTAMLT